MLSKKKRVLVLTSTFPRWQGDSEPPFVFELSRRLAERFDVMVLAPHTPGAARSEKMDGIAVHRFRYFFTSLQSLAYHGGIMANLKQSRLRYLLVPFFLLAELACLVRLLRKRRVDVIHAHWLIPNGLVAVVARALITGQKPAIVCTSHGTDLLGLNGTLFRWLQKQVISKVDKLTLVSEALRERAINQANRDDIEVIPMGVDLAETFTPSDTIERNSNELLFVGRLVEQKGLRHLIFAMPEILESHPQVMLTIVGDGSEHDGLLQQVSDMGVGAHVRFLGALENATLKELYRRAAVLVSPSLAEGFGLVLVEASGCACPVVAADLPAIRDVVLDGVTGLICRQKDSADLAARICFLLEHPELRESMGRAGRWHVQERFDWRTTSRRYADLIDDLIQGRL